MIGGRENITRMNNTTITDAIPMKDSLELETIPEDKKTNIDLLIQNFDYESIIKNSQMSEEDWREYNEKQEQIRVHQEKGDIEWLRKNLDKYDTAHPDYLYTMYGKYIRPPPKTSFENIRVNILNDRKLKN